MHIFSPNDYQKNDKIIQNYFQKLKRLRWKNIIPFRKTLVLSIIFSKCKIEDEKIFKGESNKILKILGLIENI